MLLWYLAGHIVRVPQDQMLIYKVNITTPSPKLTPRDHPCNDFPMLQICMEHQFNTSREFCENIEDNVNTTTYSR